jgi:uridine kinase
MISDRVHKTLKEQSIKHQSDLRRLGRVAEIAPLSPNVIELPQTNQVMGITTLLLSPLISREEFIFYFDRLTVMLIEKAFEEGLCFTPHVISTPANNSYAGLQHSGEISAVVILRGGSTLETGLKRVVPDCRTGRLLIQTNFRTGEPELHFTKLAADIAEHRRVFLLDSEMSSGGSALMAVRVLLDHGVSQERIVFVTFSAGKMGLNRLMAVYPDIRVVLCSISTDMEPRWIEERYLGC